MKRPERDREPRGKSIRELMRDNQNLAHENQHLQRQIEQLRKELDRVNGMQQAFEPEPIAVEEEREVTAEKKAKDPGAISKCPLCDSTKVLSYTTPGGKRIWGCLNCKKLKLEQ